MPHATFSVANEQASSRHQGIGAGGRIIARSAPMREILALVRKVARSDVPVLIQGEIGTGKQTIAREIHRESPRAGRPLVHVVCGSLRELDLEEKLFGRPRDGLRADRDGPASLLEASQFATLFLDGVDRLPFWAQVKLLDVLQCSSRNPEDGVGPGFQPRVIASSTCDAEAAVVEKRFYPGLYYYLDVVRIDIPPLRHRQEDIRALAEHFLTEADSASSLSGARLPRRFSQEAWRSLMQFDWPGNILQLAAVVAHAVMLAEGSEIGQACVAGLLGSPRQRPESETISVPLAGGLKKMELALINEVIRRCRGNKAAAARALELHRRTLYRLLEG